MRVGSKRPPPPAPEPLRPLIDAHTHLDACGAQDGDDVRAIVDRVVPRACPIVSSSLGQEAPLWGALLIATSGARDRLREHLHGFRAASA